MSGGSYNYLCDKDADELYSMEIQIQEMADRLAGLGDAQDAARETQELLLNLRQFRNRIDTAANRLRELWKAVEWFDSGDYGPEDVTEALQKYREQ